MTRQRWSKTGHQTGRSDLSAIFTRHCTINVYLFQSLQNSLNGKNFSSLEDVGKSHLEQLFAQKDKNLREDGIMKLPEDLQKVVEQNDEYVVQ